MRNQGNILGFLQWVQGVCAEAGVKLKLEAKKQNRSKDLGYYDEYNGVLYVAVCHDSWPMTLAHEVSHLTQSRENTKLWAKADHGLLDGWAAGKKRLSARRVKALTRAIQRLELDAERRAVALCRKWGLSDDLTGYIRQANLDIWRYEVYRRTRVWPDSESNLSSMPDKLIHVRDLGNLPPCLE